MKLDLVIRELHRAENELAGFLQGMAEQHKADHETHHVSRDLARWSRQHIEALTAIGKEYGLELDSMPAPTATRLSDQGLGGRSEPALVLLAHFRDLHRLASGTYLDWLLLAQAAQGARQPELLELAERCGAETLRQTNWAKARLKESATQALVT